MITDMRRGWRRLAVRLGLLPCLWAAGCNIPPIWLPNFASWPVDPTGYTIETLPVSIAASYARGNDVYLGDAGGMIYKADDRDLAQPWTDLNSPLHGGPQMLFVSSHGAIFASETEQPTWRTGDRGATWSVCLDAAIWRIDEDDLGNLYAGNHDHNPPVATLYKSADGGLNWTVVYRNDANHHIHTVRWDDRAKRLYIAYGDSHTVRGQSYSDDRGATWTVIAEGSHEGHTDVAFTADYVIWASDDQTGQVFRVDRRTGRSESLMGWSQFMWFAVTDGQQQVYIGTVTSLRQGGERAALLASADQGTTWNKLLETDVSSGPYDQSFTGESRVLSAGGWLYCTGGGQSYRIRRNPE